MLGYRIASARKKAGFSDQKSFAKALNIGARTLADYENNNSEPKASTIVKIAEICKVSPEWLLFGGTHYQDVVAESSKIYGASDESYQIPAVSVKASAGEKSELEGIEDFRSYATINVDKMLFKTAPTHNMRAIQVDGYSMAPMLMPDSWVIFELDHGYDGDGIYIINWRNILMVKKVQLNMSTGRFQIISANPDYESYDVDPDDQSVFRIIGKVIRAII